MSEYKKEQVANIYIFFSKRFFLSAYDFFDYRFKNNLIVNICILLLLCFFKSFYIGCFMLTRNVNLKDLEKGKNSILSINGAKILEGHLHEFSANPGNFTPPPAPNFLLASVLLGCPI